MMRIKGHNRPRHLQTTKWTSCCEHFEWQKSRRLGDDEGGEGGGREGMQGVGEGGGGIRDGDVGCGV
jgi:hypothetical protein